MLGEGAIRVARLTVQMGRGQVLIELPVLWRGQTTYECDLMCSNKPTCNKPCNKPVLQK